MNNPNGKGGPASELKLLTKSDVAECCDVSVKSVERWINSGSLPALQITERCIRIRRSDLMAFQESKLTIQRKEAA